MIKTFINFVNVEMRMNNVKEFQRKISIDELPKSLPDFNVNAYSKETCVKNWIMDWIVKAISSKIVKHNDLIPSKSDLSKYLGVSIGTVQNAIRQVEDAGLLKSKQKLGTMISTSTNPLNFFEKSTSKREKTILAIKKYIIQKDIILNKKLPSTKKMSEILSISQNTVRLAYEFLCAEGILVSRQTRGNDSNWILTKYPVISSSEMKTFDITKSDTIVDKITYELKVHLSKNYAIGDRIPSHDEIASSLNVSVKTVHDCIKKLNKQGILLSRRGRYGTILSSDPLKNEEDILKENTIFSDTIDSSFYYYQKIENKILNLISNNYKPGDKLPSMKDLSLKFDVSTNTVRKALNSIAEQGYITFGRGRYGGTFIVDIPETTERQSYQWLSINRNFIQ